MPANAPHRPVRASALALALAAAGLLASPAVSAQEGVLHGLGWLTSRPGTEIDGRSPTVVTNNRAPASVSSSGGKAGVGLGVAGSAALVSTAQANALGLSALDVRDSQLSVLGNQVQGFVNAVGGAATANAALLSGGTGRRPLADSHVLIGNNRAQDVEAIGGQGQVGLGAVGSLQLPGRGAANALLADETDMRRLSVSLLGNRAEGVRSVGGSALANSTTLARSSAQDLRITQGANQARDVRAGGGTGSVAGGLGAQADLTGVAAANAFVAAGSRLDGAQLLQQSNQAEGLWAMGGTALANSLNLGDYQGGELRQYRALISGNRATQVEATGGSGSVLKGALAEVNFSAAALANSVSVQAGDLQGATRHTLTGNTAARVQAQGGAATANSVWLQGATTRGSDVTLHDNLAEGVGTSGGGGSIGGGAIGAFERNGRASANSLVMDGRSSLDGAPVTIGRNEARQVQGHGGLAAANSAVLGQARVARGAITLQGNRASDVRASGFEGSAGGGLLFSGRQSAMALANSLGVFGSTLDGAAVGIADNTASALSAQGGKLVANSVSIENGEGAGSRLSAPVTLSRNTAERISTGASEMAGPGHVFSEESVARAAANAVVLHENAQVDAGSALSVDGNRATQVGAVGGTALVNALAAYRGARIEGSPVSLAGNTAEDLRTGGAYNQVAGVGSARNGILVANGLYLEGEGGVRLSGSPVGVRDNTARRLNADGGRVNANALALNGAGRMAGSALTLSGNTASDVSSQGKEGTVAGFAVIDRGVGHANANALQVMGQLRDSAMALLGNTATRVSADKGVALANSLTVDRSANVDSAPATLAGNEVSDVRAADGHTALANSVLHEGRATAGSTTIAGNQGSAQAADGDASTNSLRQREGARLAGSTVAITGNRGSVRGKGTANSVDNAGSLGGSQITVLGNQGSVEGGGTVNSVINHAGGSIASGRITILGNQGSAQGGGTVNSVANRGRLGGGDIVIAGNRGSARNGGTVNSVNNRGNLVHAQIAILNNNGSASNGGTVNSVDNRGVLTGRVAIIGNHGSASQGGVVNSVVNQGVMAGSVVIASNTGSASAGGVANSVINRGAITGTVAIVGNTSSAGVGRTVGSVRTTAGVLAGAAGVTGNTPWAGNVGYTITKPGAIVQRSVTVGPAVTTLNM